MRLTQDPEPIPILYIDDDAEEATKLVEALAPSVVNPVIAFTKPQELLDYLDMHQGPFVIMVDLVLFESMDIGGGYALLEHLRKRPDVIDSNSPILAVTSTVADDDMLERVRAAGAHAFIHKPVTMDDIVTIVGRPGWFRVELSR